MLQQVVLKKLGRLEKLKTAISINLLCCSRDNFFLYAEPVAENIPAFYGFHFKVPDSHLDMFEFIQFQSSPCS